MSMTLPCSAIAAVNWRNGDVNWSVFWHNVDSCCIHARRLFADARNQPLSWEWNSWLEVAEDCRQQTLRNFDGHCSHCGIAGVQATSIGMKFVLASVGGRAMRYTLIHGVCAITCFGVDRLIQLEKLFDSLWSSGAARRVLEQQTRQPSQCESQQEQHIEPKQQHWFSSVEYATRPERVGCSPTCRRSIRRALILPSCNGHLNKR